MHYLDIHVSVDKVLKTNNIVLHVFTNTTSLLTLLNEKNYWFIYNNMIIIYNHTKVLYFMRLWEMIIYNICMHKTIFCTNIYIFYNIVRRMIARGFSLTVLFTAYKTTLVWWWSLSRSLHWSTRCYVWVMSLSVLWGGEFHTLSTLTGQSSGGMYCSPSMNSRSRTNTTWRRCCFASLIIG